jgi:hypothetical protein
MVMEQTTHDSLFYNDITKGKTTSLEDQSKFETL